MKSNKYAGRSLWIKPQITAIFRWLTKVLRLQISASTHRCINVTKRKKDWIRVFFGCIVYDVQAKNFIIPACLASVSYFSCCFGLPIACKFPFASATFASRHFPARRFPVGTYVYQYDICQFSELVSYAKSFVKLHGKLYAKLPC